MPHLFHDRTVISTGVDQHSPVCLSYLMHAPSFDPKSIACLVQIIIKRDLMDLFSILHHHLIYSIDDGAQNAEDMQQMLRRLCNNIISVLHGKVRE